MSSKPGDPQQRSPQQQEDDARKRAEAIDLKPATQQLPTSSSAQQNNDILKWSAAAETLEEETGSADTFIRLGLFVTLFGFGLLSLLGIGSLIFYGLDLVASIFAFDLDDYMHYIVGVLSLFNLTMACVGCYGTFAFSQFIAETDEKKKRAINEYGKLVDTFKSNNDLLRSELRRLEVEITHIEGENEELLDSLDRFGQHEESLERVFKQNSVTYVSMVTLWNLFQIQQHYEIAHQVIRLLAEYYNKAYQDDDRRHGLSQDQFEFLVQTAVPKKDQTYFPSFTASTWDRSGRFNGERYGAILVDEFERVVLLVYEEILNERLVFEFGSNQSLSQKQQQNLQHQQQIFGDARRRQRASKNEDNKGGFVLRNIFRVNRT